MQIIQTPNKLITKLWHNKIDQLSSYRLLRYTILVDDEESSLLYNSVTGELVLLTKQERDNLSALPQKYSPWMDDLISKGFLVTISFDEKELVDSLRNLYQTVSTSNKSITNYTILTTTDCNARCFYCYEHGIKHEYMSDKTATELVKYISDNSNGEQINIHWFGGEPLLGMQQTNAICKGLKHKGISYTSRMTTNGYLFDRKVIFKAKRLWKLRKVQITIDGTEKLYNQTKNYINPCPNPYKKVINNIRLLLKHRIRVDIRFNLTLHNYDEIVLLINEISKTFKNQKYLWVYAKTLNYSHISQFKSLTKKESDNLIKNQIEINKLIVNRFSNLFENELPILVTTNCSACNDSSLLILPNGEFGKCTQQLNDKDFKVGNLEEGINKPDVLKSLKIYMECEKASSCPFYPSCHISNKCPSNHSCSDEELSLKLDYSRKILKNKMQ